MSKPKTPDRFERAVTKYFWKELGDPTDVFVSEAKALAVTLLRREHAAVRRLIVEHLKREKQVIEQLREDQTKKLCMHSYGKVVLDNFLAALDKRRK